MQAHRQPGDRQAGKLCARRRVDGGDLGRRGMAGRRMGEETCRMARSDFDNLCGFVYCHHRPGHRPVKTGKPVLIPARGRRRGGADAGKLRGEGGKRGKPCGKGRLLCGKSARDFRIRARCFRLPHMRGITVGDEKSLWPTQQGCDPHAKAACFLPQFPPHHSFNRCKRWSDCGRL